MLNPHMSTHVPLAAASTPCSYVISANDTLFDVRSPLPLPPPTSRLTGWGPGSRCTAADATPSLPPPGISGFFLRSAGWEEVQSDARRGDSGQSAAVGRQHPAAGHRHRASLRKRSAGGDADPCARDGYCYGGWRFVHALRVPAGTDLNTTPAGPLRLQQRPPAASLCSTCWRTAPT